jgi:A/G-specific adenine glycosylase
VSRGQARFEGSDRQARGRLLAALGEAVVPHVEVALASGLADDRERAARVASSLVADGLAVDRGDHLSLP